MCGRPEAKCRNGLQVHHITYQRLGHEDIYNDLVSLCPGCHKKIHSYYRRKRHDYKH
ncbi:HNH endonuclease [Blautia obeum]|uniref:HNH endonuclease n=1 Tax=Blautia obeum TaxID=40520 RepID=UPI0034A1CA9F